MPEAFDFSAVEHQYIEMPSGRHFYLSDMQFNLEDIAYCLAHQGRWNGSSTKQISVAEHSVHVSYLIIEEGGKPFEGLTHDVPEFALGDVPGPWKALLPDYCKLEAGVWREFVTKGLAQLGVHAPELSPDGVSKECKAADWRSLFIEAREIMPSQGRGWVGEDKYAATDADMMCHFWEPAEAMERFLLRWDELTWDPISEND